MSDERDPEKEEGRAPRSTPQPQPADDDDTRPLTGESAATMRLRADPPRVTRLSRKVLAGLGLAASLGVGGALIYALQTRHGGQGQELYSTDNRSTPDGLAGLPKDYSGVPKLGPPLPGDLGRPILNAQNGGTVPPIGPPAQVPSGRARRSSAGRRSWRRRGPHGCSPRLRLGPPALGPRHNPPRQPRRHPISPASASRRNRRHPRRRTGNSRSSTSRPTNAPSRLTALRRRRRRTSCRPALLSQPR